MTVYHQITDHTKNLNKSEVDILNYCLKNSEAVIHMKIQDLADRLYTSPATLVRFCQKLEFRGFSEFKAALKIQMDTQTQLAESHSGDFFKDITKTVELINERIIDEIIEMIYHSRRIELFSVGSSRMVSSELSKKFQSIGKSCFSYDDSSLMNISAKSTTREDLIIAFSTSGETTEILTAVNLAKLNHATIISVTDLGGNTLTKTADRSLYVTSTSFLKADICIKSRVQLLILAEYLFFRYIEKYYQE